MSPSLALTAERLRAQMLSGPPARDPLAVTRRLLAVQGQDPRGARLAIRARSEGLRATDVDRALSVDRSLLIAWLNRGTLHLVCSEDYAWLHALTTPPILAGNARRLAQEGVTPRAGERGVAAIERALADEGPLTRGQLRERIEAAGVVTAGQALAHLLLLASLRGLIVRGPMAGREHAYVLVTDWLGELPQVDRSVALAELARRYLAGHAPATERDLAKWSGLGLRDVRAGLNAIGSELVTRSDRLLQLSTRAKAAELPPPRLLGAFDPLLLGWRSRQAIVAENSSILTTNGLFRAFALVRGVAAGVWKLSGDRLTLEPFDRFTRRDAAALQEDAQDVLRYLGATSASVKPS